MSKKLPLIKTALSFKLFLFCLWFLSACQNSKTPRVENHPSKDSAWVNVSYQIAEHYFVRNTVQNIANPIIEKQEDFDALFGMASTMGKHGQASRIDFNKQFVIALILPETDSSSSMAPLALRKNQQGELHFDYQIIKGEKQTYTIRPCFMLLVDQKDQGKLVLNPRID